MREPPELYVPASERAPRRDWRTVVFRTYWTLGALVIVLALFVGLPHMRLGHLRDGIEPAIWTAFVWLCVGELVAWIFRPALPDQHEQR